MRSLRLDRVFPSPLSAAAALLAALLLVLSFPDFDIWYLAWVALVPLLWAIEREKRSRSRTFLLGWLFGTAFYFGTCWWLTYAPIHYAAVPWPIAYALILIACAGAGFFPALFALIMSRLVSKLGASAFLWAPAIWTAAEFTRYWLTGNNWNAVGYSQAFTGMRVVDLASYGGVLLVGFAVCIPASVFAFFVTRQAGRREYRFGPRRTTLRRNWVFAVLAMCLVLAGGLYLLPPRHPVTLPSEGSSKVIAIQPNVPMSGLQAADWERLRQRQIDLAQVEIEQIRNAGSIVSSTVVLPESPMNFMYEDDRDLQQFARGFTTRNNVGLVFNSAEPDTTNGKLFNSAVMVGPNGQKAAQYDKVFLLPFGEAVPAPLDNIMPAFVGSFSYGRNYNMLPLGEAQAGVMICFESHFGELGRHYVQQGADVLLEMTNDGYLGPTPVLRQHLANAVFRAIETDRPLLRVTNVGITAYITEKGNVLDAAPSYVEATRVWSVAPSDRAQTFYVRFGDWFAWLCIGITLFLLGYSLLSKAAGSPR